MFLDYHMKFTYCHIDVTDVRGGFRTLANICDGVLRKKIHYKHLKES